MTLDCDQSYILSVFYIESTTTTLWLHKKVFPDWNCWRVKQTEDTNVSAILEMKGSMVRGKLLGMAC